MEAPYQPEMRVRFIPSFHRRVFLRADALLHVLPVSSTPRTLVTSFVVPSSPFFCRLTDFPLCVRRKQDDDIPDEPLAPAGGANPNATKDPVLRHRDHGRIAMDIRKATAFQGFTCVSSFLASSLSSSPRP